MGRRKQKINALLLFHADSTSQKVGEFYNCEISKIKFLFKILFLWELFALVYKLLAFSKSLRALFE
jgi:hypothetical protein